MLTKLFNTVKKYAVPVTLAAMLAFVALGAAPSTTHAASPAVAIVAAVAPAAPADVSPLSLDMTNLFNNAWSIIQALWPIMSLSAGFTLAFGILGMLVSALARAVK